MNDQDLIPEQKLTALLELEAGKVEDSLDLWKIIEKQVTASQATYVAEPDDFQNIDTVPDSLESGRKVLTFPRMLKYGLGIAAVLAIAFIIGTAIQPEKTDANKDPFANAGPSKPPNTIPGTAALVPAATPSVRMLSASLKATLTGASAEVRAVGWKPDGTQIAAGSDDNSINIWDTNGKVLNSMAPSVAISNMPWPYMLAWPEKGDSPIIETPAADFPGPKGSTHNAKRVSDTEIQVTSSDGSTFSTLSIPTGAIFQVAWSPDGKYIAASGQSAVPGGFGDIRVWIWKVDGTLSATIMNYNYPINSLAWSPDSNYLAVAAKGNNQAGVWTADGTQIADFKGDFVIWNLAWSPDGQNLAAASSDKMVRIYWNISWGGDAYKLTLAGHQDEVWAVAWSPDGRTLASGSSDKTVKLWTIK
jgi:hypothetical protein